MGSSEFKVIDQIFNVFKIPKEILEEKSSNFDSAQMSINCYEEKIEKYFNNK